MYKDINKRNEYARKYNKETYQYFKEHGICPRCRTNKPVGNFVLCPECLYKRTIAYSNSTNKQKKKKLEYERLSRQKRKEMGICSACNNPAVPGKSLCQYHLNRQKEYMKRYREKHNEYKEKENGICIYCNEPVVDGKKMCQKHYYDAVERAKYTRQFSSWRKDDRYDSLSKN